MAGVCQILRTLVSYSSLSFFTPSLPLSLFTLRIVFMFFHLLVNVTVRLFFFYIFVFKQRSRAEIPDFREVRATERINVHHTRDQALSRVWDWLMCPFDEMPAENIYGLNIWNNRREHLPHLVTKWKSSGLYQTAHSLFAVKKWALCWTDLLGKGWTCLSG